MVQILSALMDAMRHAGDTVPRWIGRMADHAAAIANPEQLPGALWMLALAVTMAVALVGTVALAHLVWIRVRQPVAGVFVSYHHSRELEAADLTLALKRSGIQTTRLPFLDEVEHDGLLDAVQQGVRRCDVFVCLPGAQASFLDAEIAMAFGLQKPVLLVIDPARGARVPNLAKKGYPIFDAGRIQEQGYAALVAFIRFIATDTRATLIAYAWAFNHLTRAALLVLAAWLSCLVIGSAAVDTGDVLRLREQLGDLPGSLWRGDLDSGTLWGFVGVNAALIALPLIGHAALRARLRARARRAVAGKRFAELQLPKTLSGSLTRAQLREALVLQQPTAHHEAATAGLVVRGHTLPIRLQVSAFRGRIVLPSSLLVLAFVFGMGWAVLHAMDELWLQAILLLGLLPFLLVAVLGLKAVPEGWTEAARTVVLDEQGLHRQEVGWRGPPRRLSIRWADIGGFEWLPQGERWELGWKCGSESHAPPWLNRDFGWDPGELMLLLREMHDQFGAAGAPDRAAERSA